MRFAFSGLGLNLQISSIVAVAMVSFLGVGGVYLDGKARQEAILAEVETANALENRVEALEIDLLQMRRSEKNFLMRADLTYAREHGEIRKRAAVNLEGLEAGFAAGPHAALAPKVAAIGDGVKAYGEAFDTLVEARTKRGLDAKSGFEGTMTRSALGLKDVVTPLGIVALDKLLLQMRIEEQDYMLHGDDDAIERFEKRAVEFAARLELDDAAAVRPTVSKALAAYRAAVVAYAEANKTMVRVEKTMMTVHRGMEPVIDAVQKAVLDFATADRAEATAAKAATEQRILIAFVAILMALAAISLLIGRVIARPISAMTDAMGRLAGGDLEVAIDGGTSANEIGEMARAVAVFRDNARERARLEQIQAGEAQRALGERRRAAMDLADHFEQSIGGIVGLVDTAAANLQKAAQTLSSSSEETSAQSTAVAAASEQASANVATVAEATEELSATVKEISRQVEQSVAITGRAVDEATATDARVRGLSDAADRIGDIVGLINEIAGKTNLLALNATIEAARAGDAGRGFAVVAHEVKGLAEQTAKATAEIGSNITAIQGSTVQAAEAIAAIGRTIDQMNGIATSIASAVEEQGVTTEEIARNVQQAAAGSDAVTVNITEVTRAAASSSAASSQVLDAATELAAQAETMRTTVRDFLATIRAA